MTPNKHNVKSCRLTSVIFAIYVGLTLCAAEFRTGFCPNHSIWGSVYMYVNDVFIAYFKFDNNKKPTFFKILALTDCACPRKTPCPMFKLITQQVNI